MARVVLIAVTSFLAGCGLLLDPESRQASGTDGGVDGSIGSDAAPSDAIVSDATTSDANADAVVPPSGCGGPPALQDDFDDGAISERWNAAGSARERGGFLEVQAPPGGYGGYSSRFGYDLSDDWVAVRLDQAPSNGFAALTVSTISFESFTVGVDAGTTLGIYGSADGARSVPYDSTAHEWMAIGETGGMIEFRVSPDGRTWSTVGAMPAPSPLPPFFVELTVQGVGDTSVARFDDFDLDGARPGEPHCFVDDMDVGELHRFDALDPYTGAPRPGCVSRAGSGVRLELPPYTAGNDACELISGEGFDLNDRWVRVAIADRTRAEGVSTYLAALDANWTKLYLYVGQDMAWFGYNDPVGGSGEAGISLPLNVEGGVPHWRMGVFGDMAEVERSIDGAVWESVGGFSLMGTGFDPNVANVGVGVDNDFGVSLAEPSVAVIDRFGGQVP